VKRHRDELVRPVVTEPDDPEQQLEHEHRKQHQVSVVRVQVGGEAPAAALDDEAPLIEEEGQVTPGVEQEHRRQDHQRAEHRRGRVHRLR
jgi:hypothetical protein